MYQDCLLSPNLASKPFFLDFFSSICFSIIFKCVGLFSSKSSFYLVLHFMNFGKKEVDVHMLELSHEPLVDHFLLLLLTSSTRSNLSLYYLVMIPSVRCESCWSIWPICINLLEYLIDFLHILIKHLPKLGICFVWRI